MTIFNILSKASLLYYNIKKFYIFSHHSHHPLMVGESECISQCQWPLSETVVAVQCRTKQISTFEYITFSFNLDCLVHD